MKATRVTIVFICFLLFSFLIVARLTFLQVVKGSIYKAQAKGQQEIFEQISGTRGDIYLQDQGNKILAATNQSTQYLYLVPQDVKNDEEMAEKLSEIVDIDKDIIINKLSNKNSLFSLIKRKLCKAEVEAIEKLEFDGIYLGEELIRYYPHNTLASDVLGFVNNDNFGQYGVEGHFNDYLQGESGWTKVAYGPFGKTLEGDGNLTGADVVLTIDKNIQEEVERVLVEYSEKFEYDSAQVVVMDPFTGKVLAMADFPSYDPNLFDNSSIESFRNKAIQSLYEPGSAFKAITLASVLNEGKITPETTYVDEGYVVVSGYKLSNYENRVWGERTMTEVLERSINTGVIFAQEQIPHNVFEKYLERFGIFEETGIELQGETYSNNSEFKKGWEVNYATASFGHGIETTLIQMASAYCALANGGELVNPQIIDGEVVKERIILQETSDDIVRMLVSVAENGYSKPAVVDGYHIAGKTGTSQIPYSSLGMNKAGYSDQTWQSFAGFAPAFDPRFVIAVKLDNPNTKSSSDSTTYVFKDIAKYILDYWQIAPDKVDIEE
jgi:stage V sporulation protein D (sporulation-specific penicillin-binding protein)